MPVQFKCQQCRKPLSTARRKAGSFVTCPRCGEETLVPDAEVAAVGAAMASMASPPRSAVAIPELVVYDDVPELVGREPPSPVSSPAGAPSAPPPPPVWSAGAPAVRSAAQPARLAGVARPTRDRTSEPWLLLSRRAVYAQAVLFCVVGMLAFAAGYSIGRKERSAERAAAVDPVLLQGNLVYWAAGRLEADAGALVLALPAGKRPPTRLSLKGLRAEDSVTSLDAALRKIGDLGGAMARADEAGEFQLVVPRPGDYYLLLISNHAAGSGRRLSPEDERQLADYFDSASDLIGRYQYHWSLHTLRGAPSPLTHEFGKS